MTATAKPKIQPETFAAKPTEGTILDFGYGLARVYGRKILSGSRGEGLSL